MPKDIDDRIEQYIRFSRNAMLDDARQRLKAAVDAGPQDKRPPDENVYAAARAFCVIYEQERGEQAQGRT